MFYFIINFDKDVPAAHDSHEMLLFVNSNDIPV